MRHSRKTVGTFLGACRFCGKELHKMELTSDEIKQYLEIINEELKKSGEHGEIIICGGAVMTLVYNARSATKDIDAIFEPKDIFKDIIHKVSIEKGISSDWLNDGAKGFMSKEMTSSVFKEYSNLRVCSIDPEPLLAMKLASARIKSKDFQDAIYLMKKLHIKKEQQLYDIVEKYMAKNFLLPRVEYFIKKCYNEYNKKELKKEINRR